MVQPGWARLELRLGIFALETAIGRADSHILFVAARHPSAPRTLHRVADHSGCVERFHVSEEDRGSEPLLALCAADL